MASEFLQWSPKFETYKRGVRKGDLLYKRPRPLLNLKSARGWGKFFAMLIVGGFITVLIGLVFGGIVVIVTGSSAVLVGACGIVFGVIWVVFCILHLIHSLRFVRWAELTDVEFVPLDKAVGLSERLLTMPEDLTNSDYNILFSRYIWADVEGEPYRDVSDWVDKITIAQRGGEPPAGGEVGLLSIYEKIRSVIRQGYLEVRLKDIEEMAGGIPSPRKIVGILQTELIPRYREELGERLAMFYLCFLATQPPTLPFDQTTSRSDMREVAEASDTREVLDYLNQFTQEG